MHGQDVDVIVSGMWPGGFPYDDYVRQARSRAGLSQREFADRAEVGRATVSRAEARSSVPSVAVFERMMSAAGLLLVVAEEVPCAAGGPGERLRVVVPLSEFDGACRDGADRRFPAHLGLIVDPVQGEWWADIYGLLRPPETFHRNQSVRMVQRSLSEWEVRHKGPYPRWPLVLERAARGRGPRPPDGEVRAG